MTGRPGDQRATGTVISSLAAAVQGAGVFRVHDVGAMADASKHGLRFGAGMTGRT